MANRCDRKLRRVMVNTNVHPTDVLLHILNPLRQILAEFLVRKVLRFHQHRLFLWTPNTAVLLIIPDQFLLFRIDGKYRTLLLQKLRRLLIDELKLLIAVGIRPTTKRLSMGSELIPRFS